VCLNKIKSGLNSWKVCSIRFRVFGLPACFLGILRLKYIKYIIMPGVLYGCETWSVMERLENRLRVFENRGEYLDLIGMK
jgi:hypothetical protein